MEDEIYSEMLLKNIIMFSFYIFQKMGKNNGKKIYYALCVIHKHVFGHIYIYNISVILKIIFIITLLLLCCKILLQYIKFMLFLKLLNIML